MTLLFRGLNAHSADDGRGFPSPLAGGSPRYTSRRAAMTHSAVWGCLRLRADLLSTLPIDVYRKVERMQVEVPKPPVLVAPGGDRVEIEEWLYSSQVDLDSCGNSFGLITELNGNNLPARIDLVPRDDVVVQVRNGQVSYRIAGTVYPAETVWHERQFTSSGLVVGLSPIAYAAMVHYQYSAAQEFAANWFAGGAIPSGVLQNQETKIKPGEADAVKARFRLAVENGDIWVTGKDWDYNVIEAQGNQANFLEAMRATEVDACRFHGVPADMIDVAANGSSITYANITQRNLQLLIINMGPAIIRREKALSRLVLAKRFVKFNTATLLRMDPETVARMLGQQVKDRLLAPSEARELDNRQPFTPEQIAEFDTLFPKGNPTPKSTTNGE